MILVSLPHDKIVPLGTSYFTYDTDDGIIEYSYALDILSAYREMSDVFPNIHQTKYGGMLRKKFVIPDGSYKIGSISSYTVSNGICNFEGENINCEFIGLYNNKIIAVRDSRIKILKEL